MESAAGTEPPPGLSTMLWCEMVWPIMGAGIWVAMVGLPRELVNRTGDTQSATDLRARSCSEGRCATLLNSLLCSRVAIAGASVYISLVEHPARMECRVELAATEFASSYRRATIMQATLAAVGLVSSIAARLAGASFFWVVGGVLLGSVIPFTLIVILPTNKQLLSPALDSRSAETERLLAHWGMLHAVRKYSQWIGTLVAAIPSNFREVIN